MNQATFYGRKRLRKVALKYTRWTETQVFMSLKNTMQMILFCMGELLIVRFITLLFTI